MGFKYKSHNKCPLLLAPRHCVQADCVQLTWPVPTIGSPWNATFTALTGVIHE